jgi:hypothetical protein
VTVGGFLFPGSFLRKPPLTRLASRSDNRRAATSFTFLAAAFFLVFGAMFRLLSRKVGSSEAIVAGLRQSIDSILRAERGKPQVTVAQPLLERVSTMKIESRQGHVSL